MDADDISQKNGDFILMVIKRMALFLSFLPLIAPTTADARPELSHVITATVLGAILGGGSAFFIFNYLDKYYIADENKQINKEVV